MAIVGLSPQGLSSLKAASNPTGNALVFQVRSFFLLVCFDFHKKDIVLQVEFGRLRAELLCCGSQLVQACRALQTAPPPAIAGAVALASRDELQRCGRVTQQLRKCVVDLRLVADQLARLYQSSFDADAQSLSNLQM